LLFNTGVLVTEVIPASGQSNSIVTISGQLLPQNEDNSTITAVLFGGVPADLLTPDVPTTSFTVTVRAGTSLDPIPNANITILTQRSSHTVTNVKWAYTTPGNITMLMPSSGQAGTRLVIHGSNLLGSNSLPQVLLAGNEVTVDFFNATTILCRASSGAPGNGSVAVNFTRGVNGNLYDGPTFIKSNAWRQLADGKITRVVPNAVAANQTVLLCGDHPLGDGNKTVSVIIGGIAATRFSHSSFSLSNYTCINVTLPNGLTEQSNNITVIANTGAIIQSLVDITFASVNTVTPAIGQYKTRVNISGINLFFNITSTYVMLAGVNATIESADEISHSWIVVTAGRPYCATQRVCMSATNISYSCWYDTVCVNNEATTSSGQIVIVTEEFGLPFMLTSGEDLIWNYNITSSITKVQPTLGQVGTRVAVNGTNLYSFGTALEMVLVNNSIAEVIYDSNNYIVFHVPAANVGMVDIALISNRRHSVQIVGAFEYKPVGVIRNLVPSVGQYGTYGKCKLSRMLCKRF